LAFCPGVLQMQSSTAGRLGLLVDRLVDKITNLPAKTARGVTIIIADIAVACCSDDIKNLVKLHSGVSRLSRLRLSVRAVEGVTI